VGGPFWYHRDGDFLIAAILAGRERHSHHNQQQCCYNHSMHHLSSLRASMFPNHPANSPTNLTGYGLGERNGIILTGEVCLKIE
jgi:hypothetical protein